MTITTIGTLSGGAGSWGACRRWIDQHGTVGMVLLFTDVGGPERNHEVGEDEDTLRFVADAAADLGAPLVTLRSDRTIWDVFREKRWLGNDRLAHCSWELKTGPAREWIEQNAPDDVQVLVGIDSTEIHRLGPITEAWKPYRVAAPLTDRPRLWKPQLIHMLRQRGMTPPRMYELGFGHANCPACVKGGQAHWLRLLRTWPERYAYAEQQEELLRAELGDVSILADRAGILPFSPAAPRKPLTLRAFRERALDEHGQASLFDEFDEGGCGCFLGGAP